MRESHQHDDDFLKNGDPVEDLLRRLEPTPSGVDRAAILSHATPAAKQNGGPTTGWRRWVWPLSTALSLTAAITLGWLYADAANRPEPQPRIVYIQQQQPVQQAAVGRMGIDKPKAAPNVKVRRMVKHRVIPEDRSTVVSQMSRSRFPALSTNADNLPTNFSRSDSVSTSPVTVRSSRNLLEEFGGLKRPVERLSEFSLFPWNL